MPKIRKTLPAELPNPEQLDLKALAQACLKGKLNLICVLGPTASGKTRYAVKLAGELKAKGLSCEIISADSRQVYRGMDIGTGKDLAEYGDVPYHLIDIAVPGTRDHRFNFGGGISIQPLKWFSINFSYTRYAIYGGIGLNLIALAR